MRSPALAAFLLAALMLASPAHAWVYTVSTSCNTGYGANGTQVSCEPVMLPFPEDCYFVGSNYVAHLNQRGNFSGSCAGDTQYVSHHLPDTSTQTIAATNCAATPFTFDWDTIPASVLSADGACLPSTQIACQLKNLMTLGCWRNSTDIAINGGFETTYETALATGANYLQIAGNKTYIPNWNLPNNIWYYYGQPRTAFITNISAVEWWGKVGNQFLNVSNFAGVPIIPYVSQSIQLPPFSDLGNLWNISYNLETNVSSVGSPHVPYFTSYIVFNDLTTFIIQNPTSGAPNNAYYNGTFSQTVNFGSKTGDAILYFVISSNYGGGDYGDGYLYLDDVRITSLCAGVNCTEALIYTPPNITTTTTTTTMPGPGGSTGAYAKGFIDVGVYFTAAAIGTDEEGAKLFIWTIITMLIFFAAMYAEFATKSAKSGSSGWQAPVVLALLFFAAGAFVGWVPGWIDLVLIIIAAYIVVVFGGSLAGGGK